MKSLETSRSMSDGHAKIELPLHARSDPAGFAGIILMFAACIVGLAFTKPVSIAIFLAIFGSFFLALFLGKSLRVFGKRAVITSDRLSLVGSKGEVWSIPWRHIRTVSQPYGSTAISSFRFEVAGFDSPFELGHILSIDKRAELKSLIQSHLPSGVEILTEVAGFHPSRKRYLTIGSSSTLTGAILIYLGLMWIQPAEAQSAQQVVLGRVAIWVAIAGMIMVGIGVVQLIGWIAWKPNSIGKQLVRHTGLEDSLWTELLLQKRGAATDESKRFAYSANHQQFNLRRQQQLGWIGLSFLSLLFTAGFIVMVKELPKGSPVAPLVVMAVICAAFVASLAGILRSWSRGLQKILPYIGIVVQQTADGLFVEEGDKVKRARIATPARLHVQTRDSSGLNSASMELEIEGKRIWIDPVSLRRIS
jgi:hypothetical protein